MLDQPFQHFPGKVEAIKSRVVFFQLGDDTQCLGIMIKPAKLLHADIKGPLSRMAEGRMA